MLQAYKTGGGVIGLIDLLDDDDGNDEETKAIKDKLNQKKKAFQDKQKKTKT